MDSRWQDAGEASLNVCANTKKLSAQVAFHPVVASQHSTSLNTFDTMQSLRTSPEFTLDILGHPISNWKTCKL